MISIQDLETLPPVCGLYLVLNEKNEVIYIGKSINIKKRWMRGHHKLNEILKNYGYENIKVRWVEIPEKRLNHAEYLAVNFYKPSLNRRKPSIV